MGDYSLSPAEVAALSLSRDAVSLEPFFLSTVWPAGDLAALPDSEPDRPRQGAARPGDLDDPLAAFMALLPDELYSLHHLPALAPEQVGIVDGEEQEQPAWPAPRAAVEGLVRVVVGAAEGCDRSCSICLEEMEVGAEARAMGCSHRYHEACIFQWLRRSSSCPLCRYRMSTLG